MPLSLSLSLHSGAARRHRSLSFSSLSGVIFSLLSLSQAPLSVSPPFFDRRHLPPLIIIVSISLLSFTYSHFLFQSIAPHHWLCDCRFLLLTVDSCSWISLSRWFSWGFCGLFVGFAENFNFWVPELISMEDFVGEEKKIGKWLGF
jgi:hypothetical protein